MSLFPSSSPFSGALLPDCTILPLYYHVHIISLLQCLAFHLHHPAQISEPLILSLHCHLILVILLHCQPFHLYHFVSISIILPIHCHHHPHHHFAPTSFFPTSCVCLSSSFIPPMSSHLLLSFWYAYPISPSSMPLQFCSTSLPHFHHHFAPISFLPIHSLCLQSSSFCSAPMRRCTH